MYGSVDGLVVLGAAFAAKVRELFDIAAPVAVAPSGVLPMDVVPDEARENTIVYSGQLHPHKGVRLAIEALKYVRDESVRLLVVGGNERLADAKACAAAHGLEGRVTFTGHRGFKEAQSLVMPVSMMLVLPMALWFYFAQNPNSTLATVLSFFPPLTPMVMMLRITASPELSIIQIAGSMLLLAASVPLVIWASAKVFRTGVLMYGKPPTLPEICRWLRYK